MSETRTNNNLIIEWSKKLLIPFLLLSSGILFAVLAYKGERWEGAGDNIWHYYFSKYSYTYPRFMLHHWGKPIFILISAPFAQFGFFALQLFNIICGLLSGYVAYKWGKQMNMRFSFAAIILTLFSPMYFACVQSTLTEPLFSLLLIYSAFLLFNEKYLWGTIIASILMYSRSEGVFIIVIFAVFLLVSKKYKYIPFLATAFLIYSTAGALSGHNFFWYFTENPYNPISPYGKGTWLHFIQNYDFIYGAPFVILFILGMFFLFRKIILDKEYLFWRTIGPQFKIFCLVFIPVLFFFIFHVYAWAEGKFASAGEWRVMASIIPLGSIICLYPIDFIGKIKFFLIRTIAIICILFFTVKAAFIIEYPLEASFDFKLEAEAAKWFKSVRKPGSKIYYAHPALIFYADWDPFGADNKECFGFPNSNCIPYEGDQKFYYIWDGAFCESSCGNKLSDIEACPTLTKMKEFEKNNFKIVFFESKAPFTKSFGTSKVIE